MAHNQILHSQYEDGWWLMAGVIESWDMLQYLTWYFSKNLDPIFYVYIKFSQMLKSVLWTYQIQSNVKTLLMIDIFQYFWTPKLGEKRRDGHSWDKNFKHLDLLNWKKNKDEWNQAFSCGCTYAMEPIVKPKRDIYTCWNKIIVKHPSSKRHNLCISLTSSPFLSIIPTPWGS